MKAITRRPELTAINAKVSIQFEADAYAAIHAAALEDGVPFAEMVRRLCNTGLAVCFAKPARRAA